MTFAQLHDGDHAGRLAKVGISGDDPNDDALLAHSYTSSTQYKYEVGVV